MLSLGSSLSQVLSTSHLRLSASSIGAWQGRIGASELEAQTESFASGSRVADGLSGTLTSILGRGSAR